MLHVLSLENISIFEQLQIEEALLRADKRNWCLINQGCSETAIVMGIAGDAQQLIHLEKWKEKPVPIIKRFTGGGTVIVDQDTLFVTFIVNRSDATARPTPNGIMQWTEELYQDVFCHADFALIENDYALKDKKIGGNAQYIQKDRWLHHTSFLWDYSPENMQYLQLPAKIPLYRAKRHHEDFLQRLHPFFPCRKSWIARLKRSLKDQFGHIQLWQLSDVKKEIVELQYRITTRYIDLSLC